jgi:flagellar motor switch protein FliG
MAPEERERVLRNMPPERRQMIEERLERWERMAPRRKQHLDGRFE